MDPAADSSLAPQVLPHAGSASSVPPLPPSRRPRPPANYARGRLATPPLAATLLDLGRRWLRNPRGNGLRGRLSKVTHRREAPKAFSWREWPASASVSGQGTAPATSGPTRVPPTRLVSRRGAAGRRSRKFGRGNSSLSNHRGSSTRVASARGGDGNPSMFHSSQQRPSPPRKDVAIVPRTAPTRPIRGTRSHNGQRCRRPSCRTCG
mmetsp:Transcript_116619/g.329850  ORF Transcript_116619/g.329850 Transcript_116619/m.329850 type:complete len:207 (-) Transcript_116619:594-1214(-)